ncbi:hypothetical protein E1162_07155 [Rhodobacteraceae bacterium RKSG542]|uniref:hypothetical protein n=1 Tax=Pseudovibrio flavus TaxID=2529854 RepID=UPI0012BBB5E3|nr:hypothetical protein [Pseudovibrio flavus]MTI17015.1 hypothetical protein [Pseudovibrio flavus]
MRKIGSVTALDDLGRVRLSKSFFMREFLYSEVANFHGIPNYPDDPDLAIMVGKRLCKELLEPLQATFGKIIVRSAYRSCEVNGYCNAQQKAGKKGYTCASNEANFAGHIWDRRDKDGHAGATACIVIPWFADQMEDGADWRSLAWWIHDNLPHSGLYFFPKMAAFNITWHEQPVRRIDSYIAPKGCLTKPGMENNTGDHSQWYEGFPSLKTA